MTLLISTVAVGTFTDAVMLERGKSIMVGKSLSTPPDFAQASMGSIIQQFGDVLSTNEVLDA